MKNNIEEKDQFIKDISNYLNELDTKGSTSLTTLFKLAGKYGKEKVRNEANKQLKNKGLKNFQKRG